MRYKYKMQCIKNNLFCHSRKTYKHKNSAKITNSKIKFSTILKVLYGALHYHYYIQYKTSITTIYNARLVKDLSAMQRG